jgi:ABC-2 type transport system permease protein
MTNQLRSEFYKLRSTRTVAGLLAALVALVALAVLLHAFALSVKQLTGRSDQRELFIDVGVNVGSVFATLLGALSITGEIRSGTIRPTLLAAPRRTRVIAAKAVTVLVVGFAAGLLATGVTAGIGVMALAGRGVSVQLTGGDYALLIGGGAAAAALWAVVGLGVGAILRSQVPTIVALLVWLLFVENLLADLPSVHRFAPGALAQALAGQERSGTLYEPAVAAALLALFAVVVLAVGNTMTASRDVG